MVASEVPFSENGQLSRFFSYVLKSQVCEIDLRDLVLLILEPSSDGQGLFWSTFCSNVCTCSGIVQHRDSSTEINSKPKRLSLLAHGRKYNQFSILGTVFCSVPSEIARSVAERIATKTNVDFNDATREQPAVVVYRPGVIEYKQPLTTN